MRVSKTALYWHVPVLQTPSPLGQLGDFAKAAGYTSTGDKPQPFDGYFFRILTKQGTKAPGGAKDYLVSGKMTGGFAILAYPAEYRNSGIMTFIVGKDGVVLSKRPWGKHGKPRPIHGLNMILATVGDLRFNANAIN